MSRSVYIILSFLLLMPFWYFSGIYVIYYGSLESIPHHILVALNFPVLIFLVISFFRLQDITKAWLETVFLFILCLTLTLAHFQVLGLSVLITLVICPSKKQRF